MLNKKWRNREERAFWSCRVHRKELPSKSQGFHLSLCSWLNLRTFLHTASRDCLLARICTKGVTLKWRSNQKTHHFFSDVSTIECRRLSPKACHALHGHTQGNLLCQLGICSGPQSYHAPRIQKPIVQISGSRVLLCCVARKLFLTWLSCWNCSLPTWTAHAFALCLAQHFSRHKAAIGAVFSFSAPSSWLGGSSFLHYLWCLSVKASNNGGLDSKKAILFFQTKTCTILIPRKTAFDIIDN